MAIVLKKGGSINLQKEKPGINKITVGLGWDVNEGASPYQFDCDASVFILGENGKLLADEYFIFYNNKVSPDGAVQHSGDNRTGEGEGDDETINIELSKLNPQAAQIVFAITIDQAEERKQDFGMIQNSFARVYNAETSEVLCQYILEEKFPGSNALIIGRFYKSDGQWIFEAFDLAYTEGLGGLVEYYQ
ncbi:MAG: TerD family protein [Mediterranea sp.]|jgi:tellurium resistance protein TerD|nr:TerD family protein [Mediterranea sp.]